MEHHDMTVDVDGHAGGFAHRHAGWQVWPAFHFCVTRGRGHDRPRMEAQISGRQGDGRRAAEERGRMAAHAGHYARIAATMAGLLTLLLVIVSAVAAHAQSTSAGASTSAKATADKPAD